MTCPNCGSHQVRTVDSRPYDSQVRRRKECTECKGRFNTIEIPLEEYKALKQKAAELPTLCGELENMVAEVRSKYSK